MKKLRAIITGIRGQDGQLLSELLIRAGYEVMGTSHQWSGQVTVDGLPISVHRLDLLDEDQIKHLLHTFQPDELYCLGARASSADLSFNPVEMMQINGVSCLRFLEAIRHHSPKTRMCYASSSEVFAGCESSPQTESTPVRPLNAYGLAKSFGMQTIELYRQQFGLFACSAISFNHESHLRSEHFVSKKICSAAARISKEMQNELLLGDLRAQRDWAYAGDTVRAMSLMLRHAQPEDFVIATGQLHTVEDMCRIAFDHVGLRYQEHVKSAVQPDRRPERHVLCGDPSKAAKILRWKPSVSFESMIEQMVDIELAAIKVQPSH